MSDEESQEQSYSSGYFRGLREGLTRFAHWKDSVQYVGTTGTTLKGALQQVDREESEAGVADMSAGTMARALREISKNAYVWENEKIEQAATTALREAGFDV